MSKSPHGQAVMRIATFNLENLDDRPGAAPDLDRRIALLRPQIERLEADILCLQEVNAQHPPGVKSGPRRLLALDRLLAGTRYAGWPRVGSLRRDGAGPMDVQNLVVATALPIIGFRQYWHDLVAPPLHELTGAGAAPAARAPVAWDRPALHVTVRLPDGRPLEIVNVHLRAPLAAFIEGQKIGPFAWRSVAGWAEGFFLAAVKRAGQALEIRLAVERMLDDDPAAAVLVCGDCNAEIDETPLRILRANEEDTANGALAGRVLVALEHSVARSQRFSVLHAGRRLMLDHMLASRALMAAFRVLEIHNEGLGDEVIGYATVDAPPDTYHAPLVAEFAI
jgi:endonuclease/exonuclease/phosphatase family metal-dependent hydrolase